MRYNLISYLIGDGIKNVAKNKKSTFSALMIMIVTMMTVGICFLIGENVKAILGQMENGYQIEVYIADGISQTEKNKVEDEIKNIEYVNSNNIQFIDKKEAFHRAKEKLGGVVEGELQGYTEDENPFPESYVVTLTDLGKLKDVVAKLEGIENVIGTTEDENINNVQETNEKTEDEDTRSKAEILTDFHRSVNIALFSIGGILVIFSIIIIGNTIKLTVHSRRKEISIMKYVGATNNFIRAPFIVEGVIIGIMSSFISVILLGGLYVWLKQNVIENALQAWLQSLGKTTGISELLHF